MRGLQSLSNRNQSWYDEIQTKILSKQKSKKYQKKTNKSKKVLELNQKSSRLFLQFRVEKSNSPALNLCHFTNDTLSDRILVTKLF